MNITIISGPYTTGTPPVYEVAGIICKIPIIMKYMLDG